MDLSRSKGFSINDGVDKDTYLETAYTLHYLSIDNTTTALAKLGPTDINRVFRQIKIEPSDIDLFGMYFENYYYLNLSVLFGYRHGSKIFQRCTDAT